jgi:hypothetical protein
MKLTTLKQLAVAFAFSQGLANSPLAAESADAKTATEEFPKEVRQAGTAIRDCTVEQRDQAVSGAKAALDDLDARINRLAAKIDGNWEQMDMAARTKAYQTMDVLRRERNEAAEWYGALKHGSKEAWEEIRNGFVHSYETLHESFARARDEF